MEQFARWSSESEVALERYVTQLNALPRRYLWWWSVAHPELEHLWSHEDRGAAHRADDPPYIIAESAPITTATWTCACV